MHSCARATTSGDTFLLHKASTTRSSSDGSAERTAAQKRCTDILPCDGSKNEVASGCSVGLRDATTFAMSSRVMSCCWTAITSRAAALEACSGTAVVTQHSDTGYGGDRSIGALADRTSVLMARS